MINQSADAQVPQGASLGHDITTYLVENELTSDGVQYTDYDSTTTASAAVELYSTTIDFGLDSNWPKNYMKSRKLINCYFDLNVQCKADTSSTADVEWKPQARNEGGTWVDLCDWVDLANVGTTWTDSARKGYAELQANFSKVPFDFRVLVKCDEINQGRARIKSGSYVRAVFSVIDTE